MIQIYREHLDFMEEARKAFDENSRLETYRNEDETLIALRYGMDRDCMQIYKLGDEVGFFANMMSVAPRLYTEEQIQKIKNSNDDLQRDLHMFYDLRVETNIQNSRYREALEDIKEHFKHAAYVKYTASVALKEQKNES